MILTKGTSAPSDVGVADVEFWRVISHLGSDSWKKLRKCVRTLIDPGVPGTRGIRIGARRAPL